MSSMSMSMSMSDMASSTSMTMPMSTGMDSMGSMGSMDSMDGMMTMDAMQMNMVFFTSHTTKLYSSAWSPTTTGQYAGTCIFLIILAGILRALIAFKTRLERRWVRQARSRRAIVTAVSRGNAGDAAALLRLRNGGASEVAKEATVTTSAVGGTEGRTQPWRLSVDLPRACLVTVIVGIGYLLMLAVMTMNVGYFLAILGGTFGADLFVGRYAAHGNVEDHDH